MPNKPITQGYKIYSITDHRYLYNFLWSSRENGLQDIIVRACSQCSELIELQRLSMYKKVRLSVEGWVPLALIY